MVQEERIVITPPRQLSTLRGLSVTAAHAAYRVNEDGRLTGHETAHLRGGWMVLNTDHWDGVRRADSLCREVSRECSARNFIGVLLTAPGRFISTLEEHLERQRVRLLVPEGCARLVRRAGVYISSALSGGSLENRLQAALDRFGPERLTLSLERSTEDFFLPAPTGCGQPLTQEELEQLKTRLHPCVFFSSPLCARYFTYMSRETGAHFVLFDDRDTMARKVERAKAAGITSFLLPWTEAADICH